MNIEQMLEELEKLDHTDSAALRNAIWQLCDCVVSLEARIKALEKQT